jgi:O-antigen/teichoic acid export membrane protein
MEDYGIYNVVAGIVTMLNFINATMTSSLTRFFSQEIGKGNLARLKRMFGLSIIIYILIVVLIIVLGETIGLWVVSRKLVIPPSRISAALWVYQFSLLSFLFSTVTVPFVADVIAHEDMNIYAYMSIVEVVLKLIVTFLLRFISYDKLKIYGMLTCAVVFINTGVYRSICKRKYKECIFEIYWDKKLFKEMLGFTGWSSVGSIINVFKFQITTVLLNQFFGPIVVAASGIANSVNAAISSFSHNFNMALTPYIHKSYVTKSKEETIAIVFLGSKVTFFLMYLFTFPAIVEMPLIVSMWLKNPPEYTVLFTRLSLLDVLLSSMSFPLGTLVNATGKIKLYMLTMTFFQVLNFPISWIVLSCGASAYSVMIVAVCITIFVFFIRLFLAKKIISFSIMQFVLKVFSPIGVVLVTSAITPLIIYNILPQSVFSFFLITGISIISSCICIFLFGLNNSEQKIVYTTIKNKINILKSGAAV